MYGEDIFPYADDHLTSNEFADVLERELPKEIFEARVIPVPMGSLKSEDLFKTLDKYYDYDPEYFEDLDVHSKEELRFAFQGKYIVTELVALNIYKEILDFYNKYNKVIVNGVDYTKDFLNAMSYYERDPNNISDPNNINEARVTPVAIGSLRSDDLIEIILKEYDNNPNFFTDDNLDIVSKDELYKDLKESDSRLIIDILVGLEIHQEILDFYSKYKKVVIDGTDYTKYFTKYINNTNEARVTPVSMSRYNNAEVNIIDNDFVVIEDNEGNEYNGDIENDGTVNFLLFFRDDYNFESMNEEEIFDGMAPKVFKQIRDAGGKVEASSDSIDVTIDVKTLKKLYPTKYIDNTNEARITPVGISKIQLPDKWKEFSVDPEPDLEEDFEVESYGAPMEGWDTNNYDFVKIMSTPKYDALADEEWDENTPPLKTKYFISTYIAFGGMEDEDERYDSLSEARKRAVKVMKEIMQDWDDEEY
jgi:hypothetical protein